MATPNYGYEKRQKELAKKRKKEEKLKEKAERKLNPGAPGEAPDDQDAEGAAQEQGASSVSDTPAKDA